MGEAGDSRVGARAGADRGAEAEEKRDDGIIRVVQGAAGSTPSGSAKSRRRHDDRDADPAPPPERACASRPPP